MEKMNFIGYYSFNSKDKTKYYYIIQLLARETDDKNSTGYIVNAFVSAEDYSYILKNYEIGNNLNVKASINHQTNRVNYNIVLDKDTQN